MSFEIRRHDHDWDWTRWRISHITLFWVHTQSPSTIYTAQFPFSARFKTQFLQRSKGLYTMHECELWPIGCAGKRGINVFHISAAVAESESSTLEDDPQTYAYKKTLEALRKRTTMMENSDELNQNFNKHGGKKCNFIGRWRVVVWNANKTYEVYM